MKKMKMFFAAGLIFVATTSGNAKIPLNDLVKWDAFCNREVEGEVVLLTSTNRQMRNVSAPDVFLPLTTNGFKMADFSGSHTGELPYIQKQGVNFIAKDSAVCFEIGYVTSSDKDAGGKMALLCSTSGYSNMGGKIFRQYMKGPGNVCLLPIGADVTKPASIRNAFFFRDNVAVSVRNLRGGDILAFIGLLDACILAAPAEVPAPATVDESSSDWDWTKYLCAADKSGKTSYSSDRDAEVKKFLRGASMEAFNATKNERYREELAFYISALPRLPASASLKEAIKAMPRVIGERIFDVRDFLPVWTGHAWEEGMPLVLNGFTVPDRILWDLHFINWAERSCGSYVYAEGELREFDPEIISDIQSPYPLLQRRVALARSGYDLKFDKTFYVWRIMATNALMKVAPPLPKDNQTKVPTKK